MDWHGSRRYRPCCDNPIVQSHSGRSLTVRVTWFGENCSFKSLRTLCSSQIPYLEAIRHAVVNVASLKLLRTLCYFCCAVPAMRTDKQAVMVVYRHCGPTFKYQMRRYWVEWLSATLRRGLGSFSSFRTLCGLRTRPEKAIFDICVPWLSV